MRSKPFRGMRAVSTEYYQLVYTETADFSSRALFGFGFGQSCAKDMHALILFSEGVKVYANKILF